MKCEVTDVSFQKPYRLLRKHHKSPPQDINSHGICKIVKCVPNFFRRHIIWAF